MVAALASYTHKAACGVLALNVEHHLPCALNELASFADIWPQEWDVDSEYGQPDGHHPKSKNRQEAHDAAEYQRYAKGDAGYARFRQIFATEDAVQALYEFHEDK